MDIDDDIEFDVCSPPPPPFDFLAVISVPAPAPLAPRAIWLVTDLLLLLCNDDNPLLLLPVEDENCDAEDCV